VTLCVRPTQKSDCAPNSRQSGNFTVGCDTMTRKSALTMHIPSGVVKRIFLSVALTGVVVGKLATMPFDYAGTTIGVGVGRLPKTALICSMPDTVPPAPADERDSRLLQCAFASSTADLLGTWMIPLDSKGENVITNVSLAAASIDFTLLHPGEEFSFNRTVGIRSEEKGYRMGGVYSNGEIIQGIGGGICMVSTALYNLALESGLKIIERHPHSGPVNYAAPGRDAAVSFGWADLRFKNDSDGILIIRCFVRNDRLIAAFYGQRKSGQTVEVVSEDYEELPYETIEKVDPTIPEDKQIVEKEGRPGFRVTIVRLFKEKGQIVKREVVSRDTILPRNKVILVHSQSHQEVLPEVPTFDLPPLRGIDTPKILMPTFPNQEDSSRKVLPLPEMVPPAEPSTATEVHPVVPSPQTDIQAEVGQH